MFLLVANGPCSILALNDSIVVRSTALHMDLRGRIAQAWQLLSLRRQLESTNRSDAAHPLARVLRREIPLVARCDRAELIELLAALSREFNFRLVIVGGSEAHLVSALP